LGYVFSFEYLVCWVGYSWCVKMYKFARPA
jgi:hypothetical protein